ncbi:MAG: glycerol kinase, partial [Sulfolobus sp.]|nr:glycerol kinase [Sulfolobus sp.]
VHVTDYSNASRTMLFNINKLKWDMELLELFNIPEEILPEVRPSSEIYGYTNVLGKEVPISSDIGDQQAALFGQVCFNEGETKATYGTGTFILMNTGNERKDIEGLLTTIAWNIRGSTSYALEGSVFTTGAALQWAKDNLGIAKNYEEMEKLASSVNNNELVYFVPALTGLGAPYWDPHARGIIIGITRNTTGAHILRALFESIAFQTKDIIDLMQSIVGKKVEELKVDGGSTKSNFLLQLLADILGIKILRPKNTETTSMGAAFLAGLTVDLWKLNDIKALWSVDTYFLPKIESEKREFLYNKWKEAVKRSMSWI